jgi:serine O-acetyltransferase
MSRDTFPVLQNNIRILTENSAPEYAYIPLHDTPLPSLVKVKELVELIRAVVFPGFHGKATVKSTNLEYHLGINIERIYNLLTEQINNGIRFESEDKTADNKLDASEIALTLIDKIPEIKRLLATDIKATFDGDPAAQSYGEVIFCYPSIHAVFNHRLAHELLKLEVPIIPRVISELAHSETGIDIHPGAQIGEYFSIDHGTGVVIGETAIIGNHVRLYQGVTLGAKSFTLDHEGNPINIPRHPILENNVVVYSNANVLGRITIGEGSIIGGNVWLTNSVPPGSRILQQKAVVSSFFDGAGI